MKRHIGTCFSTMFFIAESHVCTSQSLNFLKDLQHERVITLRCKHFLIHS